MEIKKRISDLWFCYIVKEEEDLICKHCKKEKKHQWHRHSRFLIGDILDEKRNCHLWLRFPVSTAGVWRAWVRDVLNHTLKDIIGQLNLISLYYQLNESWKIWLVNHELLYIWFDGSIENYSWILWLPSNVTIPSSNFSKSLIKFFSLYINMYNDRLEEKKPFKRYIRMLKHICPDLGKCFSFPKKNVSFS